MNKFVNYRPEIDGLRAIAVLSVIFYHSTLTISDKKFLSGGFIGVDIFFVISGYLISKIIFNEISKTGKFSFINFYKRRIKRIIPALFFVILATFPLIYQNTMPHFFIDYAKSLLSIVFFVSNLFFWSTTIGYDQLQNMQFHPFLHAWTLSLEEQFYFIFPFIFYFIYKKFKNNFFLIILISLFASLILADYMSYTHASVNFYSLPTRAWEFLAGVIVMLIEKKKKNYPPFSWLSSFCVMIGMSLILYSFLFLDDKMYLPSFMSLIPIVGTSLIIFFSNKNLLLTKALSSKLFRGVGLISYSLYLWHYPIFIIYPNMGLFFQLILILFLSVFTYFFIEKKFRNTLNNKFYSLKTIFFMGVLILIISLYSISSKNNLRYDNYPSIVKEALIEKGVIELKNDLSLKDDQELHKKSLFVIGDSHMHVLYNAIKKEKEFKRYQVISQTLPGGCYYVEGFDKVNYFTKKINKYCNKKNQKKRKDNILKEKNSIVIIGGRLPTYLYGDNLKISRYRDKKTDRLPSAIFLSGDNISLEAGIKKSIINLLDKGTKIILIYPVPILNFDPPKKIFDSYSHNKKDFYQNLKENPYTISYSSFIEYAKKSHELLDSINHPNLYKIYTHKIFCDKKKDICKTHDEKEVFYKDNNHLSKNGNNKLASLIIQKLNLIDKNLIDKDY